MTDGTSQGLFVVVSIVIFGIFVALSYTVFGDTLKPSLVGMFENATEQSIANLGSNRYREFSLRIEDRGSTTLNTDDEHTYNGESTEVLTFNGMGTPNSVSHDIVFWIDALRLTERFSNGTITLNFTAKADSPVEFRTRLGGNIRNDGFVEGVTITEDWETYSVTFDILGIPHDGESAIVSWIEQEGTVWLHDYSATVRIPE